MKYLLIPIVFFSFLFTELNAASTYTLTVDSPNINESAGTDSVNIRVTPINKNAWDSGDQIIIHYETQNAGGGADATAGSDYTAIGNTQLTITPDNDGTALVQIPVTILQDTFIEGNEEFSLAITSASVNTGKSVAISDGGLITIIDDDTGTLPSLSIEDVSIDEEAGSVSVRVSLSMPSANPVTFSYVTVDGTATSGNDYTAVGTTATISGSTYVDISIPILGDSVNEVDETFEIYLSSPTNATIGDASGVVTIIDDDIADSLSINDASIAEEDSDKNATIKIIFSSPTVSDLDITYHTVAGSATENVDYVHIASGSATIPAGSSEYDLTVTIKGDDENEDIENFYLILDTVTGTTVPVLADLSSTITIFDDDSSGACSSYVGLLTLNEYQNNPHYFEGTTGQSVKIQGNFVEIKYLDFLVKRFITDDWSVSVHGNAGSQEIIWRDRDLECVDPRYEVFQFDNNVMGARGYVVLKDNNGNEVDVLAITSDSSDYYTQQCHDFVYDTDYALSAQNKDLFREPDGTGDWVDHGSGANSGGSRCVNMDGSQDEILYTEFDAIDIDETPNTPISSGADVPIKTKVVNSSFSLNILSLEVTDPTTIGNLKNSSVTIKVYLADADGNRLPGSVNTAKDVVFTNSTTVRVDDFIYDQAIKVAHVVFEYCGTVTGATANWDTCYNTGNTDNDILQRRALSRNVFAIRPDKFNVNIAPGEILTAGEVQTGLSFTALDGSATATSLYNEVENSSFTVDVKIRDLTKVCQNQDINMTPDAVAFTDGVDPRDFIFNDVGDVNMTIKEIDGAEFAQVDLTDTPDTTLRFIEPFNVDFTLVPDHFYIDANLTDHNKVSNLTYLHDMNNTNDYSMAAVLSVDIKAMGADGQITRNYMETCYAKDTNLTLTLDPINITYPGTAAALTQFLYYNPVEDNGTADSGEGYHPFPTPVTSPITITPSLPIENSTASFPNDAPGGHGTTHIEYKLNFDRKQNLVVNPFKMNLTDISIIDEDSIAGTKGAITNQNTNLYYARTRPSKPFYDDNVESSTATPIAIDVYCDLDFMVCKTAGGGINTDDAQLNEINWWISLGHQENSTQHDGNVTLQIGNVIQGAGSPSVSPTNVQITTDGKNENVTVTSNATTLPMTVEIELVNNIDPLSPGYSAVASPYTNNWLIYNKNSATVVPEPFYKVRFINISDWAGVGETGYVLDTNASSRKTKRLDW